MGFTEAIRSGFEHYADFSGRASRSAYWWWILFSVIVYVVAALIDGFVGTMTDAGVGIISGLAYLALLLPSLAVLVRRLHDSDRSGWWVLVSFVPLIGSIVLLVFMVMEGTPGPNRYGPGHGYGSAVAFR